MAAKAEHKRLLAASARYEAVPLSDSDVRGLLDNKVNIVRYRDMHKMRTLDDVLGPHGAAVILYEAKPAFGHWCCVVKGVGGDPNAVEFFDPLGGSFPDDVREKIEPEFAAESNQDEPYLSLLMMQSPYKLSYNEHSLQRAGPKTMTCGRHCVARIMLRDLPLAEFNDAIREQAERSGTSPDAVVAAMTNSVGPR